MSMLESHGGSRLLMAMLGAQHAMPADAGKVQQLVEMGFPKERAE